MLVCMHGMAHFQAFLYDQMHYAMFLYVLVVQDDVSAQELNSACEPKKKGFLFKATI